MYIVFMRSIIKNTCIPNVYTIFIAEEFFLVRMCSVVGRSVVGRLTVNSRVNLRKFHIFYDSLCI